MYNFKNSFSPDFVFIHRYRYFAFDIKINLAKGAGPFLEREMNIKALPKYNLENFHSTITNFDQ